MTYQSMWRRAYAGAKLAAVGAVVAGVMGISAPAQAALEYDTSPNTTSLDPNVPNTLSLDPFFSQYIINIINPVPLDGGVQEGPGSLVVAFTATEPLQAVETNTLNRTSGFTFNDPNIAYIEWNSQANGLGTTFASLGKAALESGIASQMVMTTSFIAGQMTQYLIVKWDGIAPGNNWDINISAVPLPPALLLFLSGLAGIGFLGRVKSKRRQRALAAA